MNKSFIDVLKQISKKTYIKWFVFLALIYALYDFVYIQADAKKLMLEEPVFNSGLLPMMIMNIDIPLIVGGLLVCIIFDGKGVLSSLAIRTRQQMLWLLVGVIAFVGVVYILKPSTTKDAYDIIHCLIVAAFIEELIFRGLLFSWFEKAKMGKLAYLLSGIFWGAHYGIRSIVLGGYSILWAVLSTALFGAVIGTIAAILYKKTDSMWLLVYLHAVLSLL